MLRAKLFTTERAEKIKNTFRFLFGPNINPEDIKLDNSEDFDYVHSEKIYNFLSKKTSKEDSESSVNPQIELLLKALQKENVEKLVVHKETSEYERNEQRDAAAFNFRLKDVLASCENLFHGNRYLDLYTPKTKRGKRMFYQRSFMRTLIAQRERHEELIGFRPTAKADEKPKVFNAPANSRWATMAFGTVEKLSELGEKESENFKIEEVKPVIPGRSAVTLDQIFDKRSFDYYCFAMNGFYEVFLQGTEEKFKNQLLVEANEAVKNKNGLEREKSLCDFVKSKIDFVELLEEKVEKDFGQVPAFKPKEIKIPNFENLPSLPGLQKIEYKVKVNTLG